MHRTPLALFSLSLALAITFPTSVRGEHFIGVSWDGEVYRIDKNFDDAVLLQQTEWHFNSLAQAKDGRLFATSSTNVGPIFTDQLIQLDAVTGAVISVVDIKKPGPPIHRRYVSAMAFDLDGVLYATYLHQPDSTYYEELITVDPDSGIAEVKGRILRHITGMGFDSFGNLYGSSLGVTFRSRLVSIDVELLTVKDLDVDPFDADVHSIAISPEGRLFAAGRRQFSVDLKTGENLIAGELPIDLRGLAFVVPEPMTASLALLCLVSLAVRRRK
jgi:hypothetical protein